MGNRTKLDKAFGDGPFGLPDVPHTVGHKRQSWLDHGGPFPTRPDKRSWKRRRKTRWRPKSG
jgi:hypothetical protein